MTLIGRSLVLFLGLILQAGSLAPSLEDGLTPSEKEQLQRERSIDDRIKIYERASARVFKVLEAQVLKEEFQSVPATLKSWSALLDLSVKDIDENVNRKKKSKALIRFEIQLRKALSDVQGFKIRAPVDQQDAFDGFLNHAEGIRKKLVDILFPG